MRRFETAGELSAMEPNPVDCSHDGAQIGKMLVNVGNVAKAQIGQFPFQHHFNISNI